VNLSAEHLECEDLVAEVRAALERTGIGAGNLTLELTETALVHDPDGAAACLRALKELGVVVALDDFGVGHSSLSNLVRFPFDVYKIDRSFVRGLGLGERGTAMVAGVIDLAGTLSLDGPIAEGIETADQLRRLVELGCTRGQGYLLGRPAEADDTKALLRRGPVLLPEP
jgi:EAL domain-containing protein (putative c-di-GMP-specific phosphodiesterase class I)